MSALAPQRKTVAANDCQRLSKRAGDGARTRDIQLGKLVLYQLSYTRSNARFKYKHASAVCNVQWSAMNRFTNDQ